MALYPGATFKPTSWGGRTPRNRQGRGILHVAVSERVSYPPFNDNTWHFYVAKDGTCEQYVDTDFRAYGDVDANDDAIVIETAGAANPATINSEPWTPAQCARIADIMRWESQQPGGAPLEQLPDSRAGRRGWGPHRLGIKHSAGPRPGWWQPGGEVWSNALGKECPGDAKVAQVPQIINQARTGQTEDDVNLGDPISFTRPDNGKVVTYTVAQCMAWTNWYAGTLTAQVADLTAKVDELTAKLGSAATPAGVQLPAQVDVADLAQAIVDLQNKQARDGDPATGPVS